MATKDGAIDVVAAAIGLTPAETEWRKAYVDFRPADADLLAEADGAFQRVREELPASLCAHLRRFEETWRLIREDDAGPAWCGRWS